MKNNVIEKTLGEIQEMTSKLDIISISTNISKNSNKGVGLGSSLIYSIKFIDLLHAQMEISNAETQLVGFKKIMNI